MINTGFAGNFALSAKADEIYVATTYLSRGGRGDRTDVLEVWDTQSLGFKYEVVLPPKRAQTLNDIPSAVSVTSGETIEKAHLSDILDLHTTVTSLRTSQLQTSTQTNFIIRGFGNGANNPGIESSVGVFIDGVYRSRSASQIGDLVDVERIEVLRGPQSTLFGQNASVGVISVVTKKPSFTTTGMVEVGFGDYNAKTARAGISGPVSDRVAFSLSRNYNERDGYFKNLTSGNELNDRDRWDLRGQLLFNATDDLSLRLIADKSKIDELCCGVSNLVNGPTGVITHQPTDQRPDPRAAPTTGAPTSTRTLTTRSTMMASSCRPTGRSATGR